MLETDGRVVHPATGVPQGGIVSPVLSNIYLHYALDLWFHKVVRKRCRGEACLIRYADDYTCAFQYREEAEAFMEALRERLEKFGLVLSEEKTRVGRFSPCSPNGRDRFVFLGFEFYWGTDRRGRQHVRRRTAPKRLQRSIAQITAWCRENRHTRLIQLFRVLNAKLRGYLNYYGLPDNRRSIARFFREALAILFKWLNRRGQHHSYTWQGFEALCKDLLQVRSDAVCPWTRAAAMTRR